MKRILALVTVFLSACSPALATLYTYNFTGINSIIPDDDPAGLTDTRSLTGISDWVIEDVNVTINISGGYNGDLYGYLVHSSGFAVLLNRTGRTSGDEYGYSDAGFASVRLDDAAANGDIHLYSPHNTGGALTGTWAPDGRNVDPSAVLDTDARTALLSSFNGLNPNGSWTLFLADMSGGGESTLISWSLEISAVPEPTTWALIIFAGGAGAVGARRWLKRRLHNKGVQGR